VAFDDVDLGRSHLSLGQPGEARTYFEEALRHRQQWCTAQPENYIARSYLSEARFWLGIVSSHLGDAEAAKDHFAEASRITEDLIREFAERLKKSPGDEACNRNLISYQRDLCEIQGAWGDALLRVGKKEEADKAFQEALHILRPVIDYNPEDVASKKTLALIDARLGTISARRNRPAEAAKHFQDALKLETTLLLLEPANVTRQAARVLALARSGQHAEAAAEAAKVQPHVAKSPELLLQIARCYATCAAAATPPKPEYVKLALAAVQTAAGADYRDARALQTDPDLEPVRETATFQEILAKVMGQ